MKILCVWNLTTVSYPFTLFTRQISMKLPIASTHMTFQLVTSGYQTVNQRKGHMDNKDKQTSPIIPYRLITQS
ncbi:hypothetical protein CRE_08333 [Caenorhabditis remanei]|uniref:Uncharacterized protein n=1 Tax=Caenorhabditis remanei TaxID=31234 RepID=E3MPG3_CAERE|nr:hypothetical protein CRE_08333 [Caenorhabditis remanei]